MAHWEFDKIPDYLVEQGLTQRDQFNNEEVSLGDALVREVIQNSSDATSDNQPVDVRFSFNILSGARAQELRALFSDLRSHLAACQMDLTPLDQTEIRVLVIEDFNTTGLTGAYDSLDEGHFRNFWRRHGRSSKGGSSGGRWGLGKLVFSSSSDVRAFFGLTVRNDGRGPLLMGQAVLANHEVNGVRYPAHGFWFQNRTAAGLQLPVTDPANVRRLCTCLGITRTTEPGFSVAIPWIHEAVTVGSIITGIINNYYFSVLSGRLTAVVGDEVVNKQTFHRIAATTTGSSPAGIPLTFVEAISSRLGNLPHAIAVKAVSGDPIDQTFFSPSDLQRLKELFASGETLHVQLPIRLRPRAGPEVQSAVDLFMSILPDGERSFALFVRGPITLVGERKYFRGLPAYAALVATDEKVSAFLGDAENPAHTGWNSNAEKLSKNWRSAGRTLRGIRKSLRQLHELVAERTERINANALLDYFSLAEDSRPAEVKKKRIVSAPPNLPARQKSILIRPRKGGFAIIAGPGAADWEFPRTIRVRVAYDLIGGNPYKRYSQFDFDLRKDVSIEVDGGECEIIGGNLLTLKANSAQFKLEANGFDERRDLVVNARAL